MSEDQKDQDTPAETADDVKTTAEAATTPAPEAVEAPKAEPKAASKKAEPKAEAKKDAPKAEGKKAAAEAGAKEEAKEGAKEGAETEKEQVRRPSAAELLGEDLAPVKARKAKQSKNVTTGIVHVKATFNNTIVSVTDLSGNVIAWGAAGGAGFKGSRKSTAYAGTVVAQEATRNAMSHGLKEAEVRIQGPGAGRESAVRAVQSCGVTVTSIKDVTPVPHNGCRPRKRRRV
ncbi:MAG: 30S ribosomal protein S11 [Verrucomicrobia bacterium]|nr:30S ribosomal protein S11 [Verrucomicrobiota bacterium]MCH8510513.1 30S ribosomal protein S11 [Kiritimatiellia bacterium]